MTNAEAIRIINQYDCNFYWTDGEKIPTEDLIEAFELAVKALDATEPRVLTLEEANGVLNKSCLVILEIIHRGLYSVIRHGDYFTMEPSIANDYGKTFRFWSARPTDEQREAVPWQD